MMNIEKLLHILQRSGNPQHLIEVIKLTYDDLKELIVGNKNIKS